MILKSFNRGKNGSDNEPVNISNLIHQLEATKTLLLTGEVISAPIAGEEAPLATMLSHSPLSEMITFRTVDWYGSSVIKNNNNKVTLKSKLSLIVKELSLICKDDAELHCQRLLHKKWRFSTKIDKNRKK